MKNLNDIIISDSTTIIDALKVIDKGCIKLAIVADVNNKLMGTLSDGDIRRAIINGCELSESISAAYNQNPIICNVDDSNNTILHIAQKNNLQQIPLIDNDGKVAGIKGISDLFSTKSFDNTVVLMVGGLGSRLKELTKSKPKPLLPVGNKPILETIICRFIENGFSNFVLCVNYKADQIVNYFGDGSKLGVRINYVYEEDRMGTAGALGLITEKLDKPFFVMNGDILTNVDFERILTFHEKSESKATMCVRQYTQVVPFGVLNLDGERILSIEEKPSYNHYVNAGIYVLNPECLDLVPKKQFFDMPSLFEKVIAENEKACSYPIREYWMDIGHKEDYQKANGEYTTYF
jgi:dTDP-glucose pyrophosphorylase/predicted transcriptional regulator